MDMHPNLIAGAWRTGGEVVDNINPSDARDVVGRFAQAAASAAADAIAAAKSAAPAWGLSDPMRRHDLHARVASELTERRAELVDLFAEGAGFGREPQCRRSASVETVNDGWMTVVARTDAISPVVTLDQPDLGGPGSNRCGNAHSVMSAEVLVPG